MSEPEIPGALVSARRELAAIQQEVDTNRRHVMCVGFALTQGPIILDALAEYADALRALLDWLERGDGDQHLPRFTADLARARALFAEHEHETPPRGPYVGLAERAAALDREHGMVDCCPTCRSVVRSVHSLCTDPWHEREDR